jgi:hypothetical protein
MVLLRGSHHNVPAIVRGPFDYVPGVIPGPCDYVPGIIPGPCDYVPGDIPVPCDYVPGVADTAVVHETCYRVDPPPSIWSICAYKTAKSYRWCNN